VKPRQVPTQQGRSRCSPRNQALPPRDCRSASRQRRSLT
jgi:hypothetical protein